MDDSLTAMITTVTLKMLRIRILIDLDRVYPSGLEDAVIRSVKSDPPGLLTIRRELHYLSEKSLVSIREIPSGCLNATITAKGRDLVMGEFEELGIEPAASCGYAGV